MKSNEEGDEIIEEREGRDSKCISPNFEGTSTSIDFLNKISIVMLVWQILIKTHSYQTILKMNSTTTLMVTFSLSCLTHTNGCELLV